MLNAQPNFTKLQDVYWDTRCPELFTSPTRWPSKRGKEKPSDCRAAFLSHQTRDSLVFDANQIGLSREGSECRCWEWNWAKWTALKVIITPKMLTQKKSWTECRLKSMNLSPENLKFLLGKKESGLTCIQDQTQKLKPVTQFKWKFLKVQDPPEQGTSKQLKLKRY